jgi:aspartate/methionine/tyrosine aminotransferase
MSKYKNFGWGYAPLIKDILFDNYIDPNSLILDKWEYPPGDGVESLKDAVRELLSRDYMANHRYEHIYITNGAEGALNALLRLFSRKYDRAQIEFSTPCFAHYFTMAERAGLKVYKRGSVLSPLLHLIDSPSNPEGKLRESFNPAAWEVILDAVYDSPVYRGIFPINKVAHDYYVGSFNKTFGLTGMRIGWIATDRDDSIEDIKEELYNENLGLSTLSQGVTEQILNRFTPEGAFRFMRHAALAIDYNREEYTKIEKYSSLPVPKYGMFWYMEVEESFKKLLDKLECSYIAGPTMGGSENHIRLSLVQRNELTKHLTKDILKG